MLLKSKEMAYLGVLLGLNQLFIILSSVIETNTIFLFAVSALIVGIVVVEFLEGKAELFFIWLLVFLDSFYLLIKLKLLHIYIFLDFIA